jgi:hypothetical protein
MDNKAREKEFIEAIDRLADIIIEGARDEYQSELEPFDAYSAKLRLQIRDNMSQFRTRFMRGYEVIIAELKKKNVK